MAYNPKKHNRKSIRLKGYDYAQAGKYFITICCYEKAHLFGEIRGEKMYLNEAGKMIEKWYKRLESKFEDIKCGVFVIMPDHFHAIIIHTGESTSSPQENPKEENIPSTQLSTAIQWFKTMTTNEYIRGVKELNWKKFNKRIWHRDYWDQIIRKEEEERRITKYIQHNPQNWKKKK